MQSEYSFESILVRNRMGQGMTVLACPFPLSQDHICVLIRLPDDTHWSVLSKNADYIVLQLRERFSRTVKNFSMVELRAEDEREAWYGWQFNWVGNMPIEPKCQPLSNQQQRYYESVLQGEKPVSKTG